MSEDGAVPGDWDHAQDFGHQIRLARQERGLSGYELCELLDVVPQSLYQWEHGVMPGAQMLERILPVLGRILGLDKEGLRWTWEQTQCSDVPPSPRERMRQEATARKLRRRQRAVERAWQAREVERKGWADDYRELTRVRDGGATRRLAEHWGVTQVQAGSRVAGLFYQGYLAPEERAPRGQERCKSGRHVLTPDNVKMKRGQGTRACLACYNEGEQARRARLARTELAASDPRHGTRTGARDYKCPCKPCRAWMRADRKRWRQSKAARRSGSGASHPRGGGEQIEAFGKKQSALWWSWEDICVIGADTLRKRIREGWDPEEAMTTRIKTGRKPAA